MIRVFGSINLDLVARVATLPRPGETQLAGGFRESPGGKGANQALAARRAGARVALHGAVGRDPFAVRALALLRAEGVDLDGVEEVDAATGIALIHVDAKGENTITVVPGANAYAGQARITDDELTPTTTLLLQLEVPLTEVEALALRARRQGARIILNAAPAATLPPQLLDALDVLVVNQHEAVAVSSHSGVAGDPAALVDALAGEGRAAVVTLGAAGAIARWRNQRVRARAPAVEAIDTTGAGDAFVGALAAAMDEGRALNEVLRRAVSAGALACTRLGAQDALPGREAIESMAPSVTIGS